MGVSKTYLDTVGRTSVIITARNLVDEFRDRDLIISYDAPLMSVLRKPLVIFASIMSLYAATWVIGMVQVGFQPRK